MNEKILNHNKFLPLRIGINLLYLLPSVVGGTETYANGLLEGLSSIAPNHEFIIFVNQEAANWHLPPGKCFTRVICPVAASNRAIRYYFEQVKLPFLLQKYEIDLIHSLGYVGPVVSTCPSVVSIPDLNYIDQAQTMPMQRRLFLSLFSRLSASTARHVVTISQYSKDRLRHKLKLPAEKITVTHLAPKQVNNHGEIDDWHELKTLYGISEPYVVAFGGGAAHKNINALLKAFGNIYEKFQHNLVLIGYLPKNTERFLAEWRPDIRERIVITGYVPDDHIYPLLYHADLFVMPSLYEGFGLPVLEAQQAGVVVACSTAGSLPEVAGDAAVFFDPHSIESIAEAIKRCLSDDTMRRCLREKGRENLKRFSWNKTAAKTIKVYHDVLRY